MPRSTKNTAAAAAKAVAAGRALTAGKGRHWTDIARGVAGAADLQETRFMASNELGTAPTARDLAIYRVIGARQVAQAFLAPRTGFRAIGALLDVLHIGTMVGVLVAGPPKWRRAACVQIAFAALMLIAGPRTR